jgi:hypothetical protein
MNDGNHRAKITPTDLILVPLAFLVTLLWSHLRNGDWDVTYALLSGVLIGGAGILGQHYGRNRRS